MVSRDAILDQNDKIEAGKRLRVLRKQRHVSQVELAKMVGLAQAQISAYERGEYGIGFEAVIKISKALKISPLELVPTLNRILPGRWPGGTQDCGAQYPVIASSDLLKINRLYEPVSYWAQENSKESVWFSRGRKGDVCIRISDDDHMEFFRGGTLVLVREHVRLIDGARVIAALRSGRIIAARIYEETESFRFECGNETLSFRKDDFYSVRFVLRVIQTLITEED